jgi:hypothetical protein
MSATRRRHSRLGHASRPAQKRRSGGRLRLRRGTYPVFDLDVRSCEPNASRGVRHGGRRPGVALNGGYCFVAADDAGLK